jgi:cytochrome P450
MCAALTFALWDFARFPDFRKHAAEEIAKFFPSREDMTALALEELPFLNAFILESMRFHGLAVSLNERISPENGAVIQGQFIPSGVHSPGIQLIVGDGYVRPVLYVDGS